MYVFHEAHDELSVRIEHFGSWNLKGLIHDDLDFHKYGLPHGQWKAKWQDYRLGMLCFEQQEGKLPASFKIRKDN